jgi:hypothetical protein
MKDTRPPPLFITDNLGLDFLNTLAVPAGAPMPSELAF